MSQRPLKNYLRTYRRRSGLSQAEAAVLLGASSGSKISRYENFARTPAVMTIWAYEIVFKRPSSELFAGQYHEVQILVKARAKRLIKLLMAQTADARTARKLELLGTIFAPKPGAEHPLT